MNGFRRVLGTIVLACVAGGGDPVPADGFLSALRGRSVTAAEPTWQEVHVPVAGRELADWLGAGWLPITADRYARFRAAEMTEPRGEETAAGDPRIEEAEYEATFADGQLVAGRMTGRLRLPTNAEAPILVSPFPLDLPLRDVRTESGPAVWGAVDGGRTSVLVAPGDETLTAAWELAGQRVGREVTFYLRLARATISTLRIRLPAGFALSSDVGIMERDATDGAVWIARLGAQRRCTLRVAPAADESSSPTVVLVDRRVRFGLQPEGVRFRAEFDATVLRGSVASFAVALPAGTRIESATYGDTPLSFGRRNDASGTTVELQFADAVLGTARTVTLRGDLPLELGSSWSIPSFAVLPGRRQPEATFVQERGTLSFDVAKQLHVAIEKSEGLRRVPDDGGGDERSLAFAVVGPRPEGVLVVSYPELVMQADVVSVVDLTDEVWSLRSAIQWRARSGRAFRLRMHVPRGWRVADVFASNGLDATRIIGWHVTPGAGGAQIVSVDLLGSLAPSTPRTLFLDVRFDTSSAARTSVRPVIRPMDCETADTVLIMEGGASPSAEVVSGAGFRAVERASLPEVHRRLVETLLVETSEGQRVFRSRSPGAGVVLVRSSERRRSSAVVRLRSGDDGPEAVYELQVDAGEEPVPFRWTTTKPPSAWHVEGHSEAQVVVEQGTAEPPSLEGEIAAIENGNGPVWRYRPIGGPSGRTRLVAVLPLAEGRGEAVPLPYVGEGFRGVIRVPAAMMESYAPRVEYAVESAAEVDGDREWSYTDGQAQFVLGGERSTSGGTVVRAATLALRSVAGVTTETTSEAVFTTIPDRLATRFDFALPAGVTFVDCSVDGRRVVPVGVRGDRRVPLVDAARGHEITIRYRRLGGAVLRSRVVADVPITPTEILGVSWEIVLPPAWSPVGAAPGVRLGESPHAPNWRTRLFGPLARAASAPVFQPLRPRTWWTTAEPGGAGTGVDAEAFDVPEGWQAWRATTDGPVGDLAVTVSNSPAMERLGWVSLFGCLLVGTLLRAGTVAAGWRVAACVILVSFAAGWVVPVDFVVVLGGAIAGTIGVGLLPRTWFARTTGREASGEPLGEGSTTSYQHVTAGALLFVLLTGRTATSDDRTVSPPSGRSAVEDTLDASAERVLVPEPRDGSAPRVVYVTRALLSRIEESERTPEVAPRYLLQSASYETALTSRGSPVVLARYRVVPLDDDGPLRLELPLRGSNPGGSVPCRVNGREATIETTDDPAAIVVVLDRRPDGMVTGYDVELTLHPAIESNGATRSFVIRVPRVVESRFVATLGEGVRDVTLRGIRGVVEHRDAERIAATLGPVGEVTLGWSTGDEPITRPRDVALDVHVLATVASSQTRLAARLRFATTGVPVDEVVWDFPSSFALIRATPSLDARVDATTTESGTRLVLSVPRSFTGDELSLDLEFVVPPDPGAEGVRIPPLAAFTPRSISPDHLLVARTADRVGIVAGPAFRVRSARLESGAGLRNLAVDAFRNSAAGWAVPVPELACVLDGPSWLDVELAPRTPVRTVQQLTEYRLSTTESTWNYVAEVDVGEASVFGHRLALPRDLVVGSVSVLRDGVERVRGWERRDGVLSIDLDDRAIGPQRIAVTGWLPIDVSRPIVLPAVRLLDADTTRAEVLVQSASDLVATLVDGAGTPVPASEPAESVDLGETTTLGRFVLSRGDPELQVRLEPRDPRIALLTLSTVEWPADGDAGLEVRTRLRIDSPRGPWGRLQIRVPAGLVLRDVLVDAARIRAFRSPVGPSTTVTLVSRKPSSTRAEVTVVCARKETAPPGEAEHVDEGETLAFGVPTLVETAATERHWLVVPENYEAVGGTVVAQRGEVVSRFPEVAEMPAGEVIVGSDSEGGRDGRAVEWQLRAETETTAPHVVLLEHRTRLRTKGVAGTTLAYVAGRRETFVLDLGEGRRRRVRSVLVDGRATDTTLGRRTVSVPLEPSARRSLVRVDWVDAGHVTGLLRTTLPLPRVRGLPVDRTLVRLADESNRLLRVGSTVRELSPADFSLERLGGLLDGAAGTRSVPAWLADESRGELDRLVSELESTDEGSLDELQRDQSTTIGARLDELVVRDEETAGGGVPTAVDDDSLLARVPPNAESISVGVVSGWVFLLPVPLLVFAIVAMLRRRPFVERAAAWIRAHPAIVLAGVGLVWWTCLRPSVLGLGLLVVAVFLRVRRPTTRTDRSEIVV